MPQLGMVNETVPQSAVPQYVVSRSNCCIEYTVWYTIQCIYVCTVQGVQNSVYTVRLPLF